MSLLAPIWLLLLVPWSLLAVALLRSQSRARAATAVFLWPTSQVIPSSAERRSRRRLPWWARFALLSLLLAIVGLASPAIGRSLKVPEPALRSLTAGDGHWLLVTREVDASPDVTFDVGDPVRAELLPLPSDPGSRHAAGTIPAGATVIEASLDGERLRLRRDTHARRIVVDVDPPMAIADAVNAYVAARPAEPDAPTLTITDRPIQAAALVVVEPASDAAGGPFRFLDHPAATGVDPARFTPERAGATPPAGFTPVITAGDRAVLAVREGDRSAWLALDPGAWADDPAFVLFVARLLEWSSGASTWVDDPAVRVAESGALTSVAPHLLALGGVSAFVAGAMALRVRSAYNPPDVNPGGT